jgi:hypothetical protein
VISIQIKYPEIGICGLSCRLCPRYQTKAKSKCGGCKSEIRVSAGCPFITCAIKKKELEFCWDCEEGESCKKWQQHRYFSRQYDTFKCYQKLEDNIAFIKEHGIKEFEKQQKMKERILLELLNNYDDGRSKNFYGIAATVMDIPDLEGVLEKANKQSKGLDQQEKAKLMHSILDEIAEKKNLNLKLRKYK